MDTGRVLADEQVVGDLTVRPALRDEREDLPLAASEAELVGRPGRRCGVDRDRGIGCRQVESRPPTERFDLRQERCRAALRRPAPCPCHVSRAAPRSPLSR